MNWTEVKNWIVGVVFGVFSVLFVVLPGQGLQLLRGTVMDLPQTPESFVPTVRLVLFTDTHNQNDHVADAIDTAYAMFDEDAVYAGVDGFFCLGDFSSVGAEGDYVRYAETLAAHVRPETKMITIHGNHEFKDDNYREYFLRNFGYDPNTVTQINGFSCIAFSGERSATEWTFTPGSLKWLDDSISAAEKTADGKAIFVFQHPHAWGTVYGSSVWGDPQLNPVFNKHPGIVDFSGHSHFPLNDPRSIWQGSYTAVGCGAMATFELDAHGIPGQHPDGYDPAAEMCIVEADNDGSVRLRGYDLLSDTYFCDYYIDDVNDSSCYAYTYKNMKAKDAAPVFPADAKAGAYQNENGEWILTFDEAQPAPGFVVHDYKVKITDADGKTVLSENFINDYFVIDGDSLAAFRIGADTLVSGADYTLTVRAESAYHKFSETVKLPFTAE